MFSEGCRGEGGQEPEDIPAGGDIISPGITINLGITINPGLTYVNPHEHAVNAEGHVVPDLPKSQPRSVHQPFVELAQTINPKCPSNE